MCHLEFSRECDLVEVLTCSSRLHLSCFISVRVFMTMDPNHGEISRAMRNRSAEIYLHGFVPGPEGFRPAPHQNPSTDLCTDLDELPAAQVTSELNTSSQKHGPIPFFEPGSPWWDLRLLLQSRGLVSGGMCDFLLQLQVMMSHDVQCKTNGPFTCHLICMSHKLLFSGIICTILITSDSYLMS